MSGYINTVKDLEAATYGYAGAQGKALLKAAGVVGGSERPTMQQATRFLLLVDWETYTTFSTDRKYGLC